MIAIANLQYHPLFDQNDTERRELAKYRRHGLGKFAVDATMTFAGYI